MSLIDVTPSAYSYPLLIKQLLYTPLRNAPDQEIVYRDLKRLTYRTLRERIGRLASGLSRLGVKHGDTVAVMDWDSHRYLGSVGKLDKKLMREKYASQEHPAVSVGSAAKCSTPGAVVCIRE